MPTKDEKIRYEELTVKINKRKKEIACYESLKKGISFL
jgi:hypothetical protein